MLAFFITIKKIRWLTFITLGSRATECTCLTSGCTGSGTGSWRWTTFRNFTTASFNIGFTSLWISWYNIMSIIFIASYWCIVNVTVISFWNMRNIIIIMMQTTALKNIKEYTPYLLLKHILPVFLWSTYECFFLLISIQNTYFIKCNCHSINLIKVNDFQRYIVY